MREIKFRAWDSRYNKMESAHSFYLSGQGDTAFGPKLATSGVIPMQYTGLKDKNGVEIYEGDIVAWTTTYNTTSKDTHIDEVSWENEYGCYMLMPFCHEFWAASKEVIGNIYENPELLK